MSEPELVIVREGEDRLELLVNFGMFGGRAATQAEILRLGETLLRDLESVEIVSEERFEFDRDSEATVYQVRIDAPRDASALAGSLRETVAAWARECFADRRIPI